MARVETAAVGGQLVIAWHCHCLCSERVVTLTATAELSHVLLLSRYIKWAHPIFFIQHVIIVASCVLGVEGTKRIALLLSR